MGMFNNYVTLKLPFFDQPTTRHHATSRMKPPLLRYVTPDTDPPFIIYFCFLKLKKNKDMKKMRTHPWYIHPCF